MFKPEYIRDNIRTFGYYDAYMLIVKRLKRMGKADNVAHAMATALIESTYKL